MLDLLLPLLDTCFDSDPVSDTVSVAGKFFEFCQASETASPVFSRFDLTGSKSVFVFDELLPTTTGLCNPSEIVEEVPS